MPILIRYIVRFVLLAGVIATAGCSWPGVKIGDDRYLLSPPPSKAVDKE
jgi:hypothetical protein